MLHWIVLEGQGRVYVCMWARVCVGDRIHMLTKLIFRFVEYTDIRHKYILSNPRDSFLRRVYEISRN